MNEPVLRHQRPLAVALLHEHLGAAILHIALEQTRVTTTQIMRS